MEGGLEQTILIIGVMVAVLLGAYYVTKFLAKRGKRLTQSKYIKVVDQIFLSTDKQIALIKFGGKNILVGITNQSINLIAEMDEEDTALIEREAKESAIQQKSFSSTIIDFINKARGSQEELKKTRKASKQKYKNEEEISEDEKKDFASIMELMGKDKDLTDNQSSEGKSK